MNETDFILKWTEDLKSEISRLEFSEDDIRKNFFGLLHDATYSYYLGYVSYNISLFINQGQIGYDANISYYKTHFDRLAEISKLPILKKDHLNSLNRSLNIDSWSIFELCTTTFCFSLCDQAEMEKLLSHQYAEVAKILKNNHLNTEEIDKLKKQLIKEHLTHVPINRKTDFLFKKAVNYYRDVKKDKEFLIFFGKLRNTIHTNYIYYGKDYEYKFGNAHFKFENGMLVKWIDPFEPSPKLFFYLVGELKEIWKTLITVIKFENTICYPDVEQN
jgi:hypothetical protein